MTEYLHYFFYFFLHMMVKLNAFSALTLLFGRQVGHLAFKN